MAAMTKPESQRPHPPRQATRSAALPTVEPQTLRAFAAVAREGNVSRAAQRLHLSQPAVSLQLKTLSEATGLVLFARTPQGMAPIICWAYGGRCTISLDFSSKVFHTAGPDGARP
jgi:hypothetical protein